MNRFNLPWVRNWEQLSMDIEADNDSILKSFCSVLVFIALAAASAVVFMDGLDRSAVLAKREAQAQQRGRIEMLAEVNTAFEREGRSLETYYRWASKKGTTGFDGLVLAENNDQGGN